MAHPLSQTLFIPKEDISWRWWWGGKHWQLKAWGYLGEEKV